MDELPGHSGRVVDLNALPKLIAGESPTMRITYSIALYLVEAGQSRLAACIRRRLNHFFPSLDHGHRKQNMRVQASAAEVL